MAFKTVNPLVNKLQKTPFRYGDYLDQINDMLNGGYLEEIDLGDGYTLSPQKRKVYGDDRDYNVEFDILNGDEDIDSLGVYGTDFDEGYQTQLQDIIDRHRNARK